MNLFRRYSVLSNFRINFSKSSALNVSVPSSVVEGLAGSFAFKWSSESLKYLGVHLSADPSRLFALNFPPILHSFRSDCDRWNRNAFTWLGRCAIFKMNILPRLLYCFQALPIHIPASFFRSILCLQLQFIWAGKPARVGRRLLYRPKHRGGLGLPDVRSYYLAAHLSRVIDWCRHSDLKPWILLEQSFTKIPLSALPWLRSGADPRLRSHPLIGPTLACCSLSKIRSSLLPLLSPMTPVLGNPDFPSSLDDPLFRTWIRSGQFRVEHFGSSSSWPALSDLAAAREPCQLGPWRSMQLAHFLSSLPSRDNFEPSKTQFEALCSGSGPLRHTLSLSYSLLLSPPDEAPPRYLLRWEEDLNLSLSPEDRGKIFLLCHKSSISSRFQEAGFKLLTRWYRVPALLHSWWPEVDPCCWRCGEAEGTLLHIFWSCRILTPFWHGVCSVIREVTGLTIRLNAALFLLHHCGIPYKTYKKSLLRFLVMAARACIPLLWRRTDPPGISLWLTKVNDLQYMEDLSSGIHNTQDSFRRTWFHWMEFRTTSAYADLMAT